MFKKTTVWFVDRSKIFNKSLKSYYFLLILSVTFTVPRNKFFRLVFLYALAQKACLKFLKLNFKLKILTNIRGGI